MGRAQKQLGPDGEPQEDPLVQRGHFQYHDRPRQDVGWTVAYVLFLALSVVGGVYATSHRNHDFGVLLQRHKSQDPSYCPAPTAGRRLLSEQASTGVPDFANSFIWALVGTVIAALLAGIAFLAAFRHKPLLMVKVTIAVQVALPVAAGLFLLAQGSFWPAMMMLFMGALAAWAFYLWRDFVPLCARLLGVSAQGLNENPGLITFCVLANVAMAAMLLPLTSFSGIAITNGQLIPNPAREGSMQCVDTQGQEVPCCSWQPDAWVPWFASYNMVVLLWTAFLVGQLRVFVIAGTIAQWYFAPMNSSTSGTTMRSVKHGLGPSFGSLCFGSAILTVVQLIRNAMEQARQNANQENRDLGQVLISIAVCIASCILECVLQLVEFLTKFATVSLAISGQHFLGAARTATDLLKRNFLKTYGVWFFPPMVLQTAAFLISAAWGVLVAGLGWLGWHSHESGTGAAIALGVVAFFLAWLVQSFFAGVLLSVVDAVYYCYALDLDSQAVTKSEVHEVFSQVPVSQGAAIEQPDGNLAYGQGQYVPPSSPEAVHGTPRSQDHQARV